MSVEIPINAVCTFCGKPLKAKSVNGVKVLEEKCDCRMSKDYFDSKVVEKPRVYKKPKEISEDG